jgi:LysM repeat protein
MRGWHSGSGSKGLAANANNNGYIGFEICEDGLTDKSYFEKVYREAVELCAYLCKAYGIKPESPTLICHSEGHKLGIASNHGDVMHWWPRFGKSMDTFRADVKVALGTVEPAPIYEIYSVVKGDSLWKIAAEALGNGARYPEIKSLNGLSSNIIFAGQKLKIPQK